MTPIGFAFKNMFLLVIGELSSTLVTSTSDSIPFGNSSSTSREKNELDAKISSSALYLVSIVRF